MRQSRIKDTTLISESINGTGGGGRIPGAIIEYTITMRNTGDYSLDSNTMVVFDVVDSDSLEFDVNAGVALGTVTYAHCSTRHSIPVVPTGPFDPNAAGVNIEINGNFSFGGVPEPEFIVTYRVRIK